MILTYKSVNTHNTVVTMTLVSDNKTWFLNGYSDNDRDLFMDLMVDGELIDTILVAAGNERDALFLDIPDLDFPEDDAEESEYDKAVDAYFATFEKRRDRENEIFSDIYNEIRREIQSGEDLIELEIIIPVCIAHLIKKVVNKDL